MNKFISHGDSPSWRSRGLTTSRVAMLLFGVAMVACVCQRANAQHADVLVQVVDGRLATGSADFISGQWTLGRRVYPGEFGSIYSVNDPGFNSLAVGSPSMPAGATSLPGNTPLGWDFLPMKIDDALANLFYWDGLGGTEQDVNFGGLPGPDYRLELYGRDNIVGVDGAPTFVAGDVINNTTSSGSLHTHRFFYLDSGNQNATTTPADGIYLVSARMTMPGFDPSQPIYFVFGTPGSTLAALQAAETWLTNRVDDLAPDFNADFNDDFVVDGADFLIWQRNLGATDALLSAGDADRDGVVGAGDLAVWREEFGLSLETFPGAQSLPPTSMATHSVPEPSALALAACGIAVLLKAIGSAGGRTTK
jgi:hypothetical protein